VSVAIGGAFTREGQLKKGKKPAAPHLCTTLGPRQSYEKKEKEKKKKKRKRAYRRAVNQLRGATGHA